MKFFFEKTTKKNKQKKTKIIKKKIYCSYFQKGHTRCIRTLLSFPETDVNCKDDSGRTLISQALEHLDERGKKKISFE